MIETTRLRLRSFRLTDRDRLASLLCDAEVMRFSVSGPKPYEDVAEDLADWIDSQRPGAPARWAVTARPHDELVGFCGFSHHPVAGEFVWELGFRLLPECWGQGFATEAAAACRDWFFRNTHHKKFVLMIDAANLASRRVAQKIGAAHEFDAVCYGIKVQIHVVHAAAD